MDGVGVLLRGRAVVAGRAQGRALVTDQPLSFWGGVDPASGEIIDRHHPLSGASLAGRVLVLPRGRGSCSASGVLLEAIRNGVGPAAIVTTRMDPILGLGAILAEELFGTTVPVVVLSGRDAATIRPDEPLTVGPDGSVRLDRPAPPT